MRINCPSCHNLLEYYNYVEPHVHKYHCELCKQDYIIQHILCIQNNIATPSYKILQKTIDNK